MHCRYYISLALLLVYASRVVAQGPVFQEQQYPVAANPRAIAINDLNADGRPDLVTANASLTSNNVSVLLGTGVGTFGQTTNFSVGANSSPYSIAINDLSGDGKPDLVTANYYQFSNGTVSVLLGNGEGTFVTPTNFDVGGLHPHSIAIDDINTDGKLDIVTVVDMNNAALTSVLLGDGLGSFAPAITSPVGFSGGTAPISIGLQDLNADGKPDLATANYSLNTVSVLLGTGTGSFFGFPNNFSVYASPNSVAVDDLNNDGKLDFATADYTSNAVSVLLGNGAGLFGAYNNYGAGANPSSVAIGGIDGDGKADIVTTNVGSNNISLLMGNGTGSFGGATNSSVGNAPQSVAIFDLNGDGRSDVATSNSISNSVSVLLNQPVIGVNSYGFGTSGCAGAHALSGINIPKIGNTNFTLKCTKAPVNSLGGWFITDSQDLAGSDPFFVGVKLHVEFFNATESFVIDSYSDAAGI